MKVHQSLGRVGFILCPKASGWVRLGWFRIEHSGFFQLGLSKEKKIGFFWVEKLKTQFIFCHNLLFLTQEFPKNVGENELCKKNFGFLRIFPGFSGSFGFFRVAS